MQWQSPICLLSGHIGFAEHLDKIPFFPAQSIGAIILKATTLEPRNGHPADRISETPLGLINSVGLENPGVDAVIKDKIPALPKLKITRKNPKIQWIINVAGSKVQDYADVIEKIETSSHHQTIAGFEINISCPNVQHGGAIFGHDEKLSAEVVSACRAKTDKTLIVKLSPNQTDISRIAEICIQNGANILSAINTVAAMNIDPKTQKAYLSAGRGGLSGKAILPIALLNVHLVWQVAKTYNIPVIGHGGISNGDDAIAMLLAGASAIGIGTALSQDIRISQKILNAIKKYSRAKGYKDYTEIIGKLTL
jgi:dihydroorotate dehydrogenase (NAD+) catalytic subunit